jgi:hypothetical protein
MTTHDFSFKAYVRENEVSVTMPSGYDGKCLVGYVYNDSASNFVPFTAVDRDVIWISGPLGVTVFVAAGTATTPQLLNMSSIIPPVPVRIRVATDADGTGIAALGPVPTGFLAVSGNRHEGAASTAIFQVLDVHTETQAIYAYDTSGTYTMVSDSYVW